MMCAVMLSGCHGIVCGVQPYPGVMQNVIQTGCIYPGAPFVKNMQQPVQEPLHILDRSFYLPAIDRHDDVINMDGIPLDGRQPGAESSPGGRCSQGRVTYLERVPSKIYWLERTPGQRGRTCKIRRGENGTVLASNVLCCHNTA